MLATLCLNGPKTNNTWKYYTNTKVCHQSRRTSCCANHVEQQHRNHIVVYQAALSRLPSLKINWLNLSQEQKMRHVLLKSAKL